MTSVVDFAAEREARRPPHYLALAQIRMLRELAEATHAELGELLDEAEAYSAEIFPEWGAEFRGFYLHRLSQVGNAIAGLALQLELLRERR